MDDEYRSDLPSRWTTKDRSDREIFYQKLYAEHIQNPNTIENSFDVKWQRSTSEAALLFGTVGNSLLIKGVSNVEKVADKAFASAMKAENQLNKALPVVNDALNKAYVNGQLAYADMVGKGVNGVRGYVRNTIKSMGEQPVGSVLKGAATSAGVKSGFEAYDYANGKLLTLDNLKNSGVNVVYSGALAAATAGMPIIPATGLGIMGDWAKDGKYDVVKTSGGSIVGASSDRVFYGWSGSPFVREVLTNSFEKIYDYYDKEKSNEQK
ncbi:hypothetical protein BKK52_11885 [Rodentibacter trehalosifermentans]|uniref:Uncharacterized protein n=1 Tax=Rodentibacter trehalosifermentans TaxID=1908263 RepID=A0A1V3IVL1_9PAST|nr:hypothetical protein [Rodentibacter trehalosifermentans]OOF45957.1 hypothetical protein BKK52_11885 [Rodentibacter trehalosifermentans]